jgi:hypothetical protein
MSKDHQDLIPVHVFNGPVEKALVADVLNDMDIPFLIDDHRQDQLGVMLRPQLGAGRLMVLEGDRTRVESLLAELKEAADLGAWIEE